MWGWIGMFVVGLLVAALGLWGVLVVSMRTKFEPVLTAIRRMNRRFTNPRVMRTAGRAGASAAVIRHTGRSSGRAYETPIGVVETGSGFVVALPYGVGPDWVKNVRASGSAVVVAEGSEYSVADPDVVPAADVDKYFSTRGKLVHRLHGVDQFLVLNRVVADSSADEATAEARGSENP